MKSLIFLLLLAVFACQQVLTQPCNCPDAGSCWCDEWIKNKFGVHPNGYVMDWGSGLAALGYSKSSTPVKNAIVIMQPSFGHGVGDKGHVAWSSDVTDLGNGKWKLIATGANQECWIYGGCYNSAGCDNVNDWEITDSMNSNQIAFYVKGGRSPSPPPPPPPPAHHATDPPSTVDDHTHRPDRTRTPRPDHTHRGDDDGSTRPGHTHRSDKDDDGHTRRPDHGDRTPKPDKNTKDKDGRKGASRAESDSTSGGMSHSAWVVPVVVVVCVVAVAAVAVLVAVFLYKRRINAAQPAEPYRKL